MARRRTRTPPLVRPVGEDELLPIREHEPIVAADDEIGAEPYFPPTDPVVAVERRGPGSIDVLGGFSPTSMASVEVEPSAGAELEPEAAPPGDEAIAEAIRRELHEDAATADLELDVRVRSGVVRLRGSVPEMMDAENAEEVASRVPGVREVLEELVVAAERE